MFALSFRLPRREEHDGFTLVELLIVMLIIGILAGIAIPVFLSQKSKAKDSSAKADLFSIVTDVNSVLVDGTASALTISGSSGTYTVTGTDANGNAVNISGKLSPGNTVNSRSAYSSTAGTFCVEVDTTSTGTWRYNSASVATASIAQGTC